MSGAQVYAHIWTRLVVGHVAIIFALHFYIPNSSNIKKKKKKTTSTHLGVTPYGRGREYVIMRDKKGMPYKVALPKGDPGGEHE